MGVTHNSPTPLYVQIKEYIRAKIRSGEYATNTRLPSERQLASQFDVSRLTVTKALKELEQEGMVYTQIGKGTYAAPLTKIRQRLNTLASFTEVMTGLNKRVSSRVLTASVQQTAERAVLEALQITPATTIFVLERLRLADDLLIALERAHIPYALCPDIEANYDFSQESLYHVLRTEYGIQLTVAHQSVEARLANPTEAQLLAINVNNPVLSLRRTTFNHLNQPVEFVQGTCPGDRYTLQIVLRPSGSQVVSTSGDDYGHF